MQKTLDPAAEIARLTRELAEAKRAVDLKVIALRRANSWLADRIRDVEQLRSENTYIREKHHLPPAPRNPFDTFDLSRESLQ